MYHFKPKPDKKVLRSSQSATWDYIDKNKEADAIIPASLSIRQKNILPPKNREAVVDRTNEITRSN